MRRGVYAMLGIVLISLLAAISTFVFNKKPGLGLDLAGGISIVLDPYQNGKPAKDVSKSDQEQVIKIMRNRVDALGVAEPEISTQGSSILVQIPGIDDQERALELVGRTAELQFRPVTKSSPTIKTDQEEIDKLRETLKIPDGVTAKQIDEQESPPTTATTAPSTTAPQDLSPTAPPTTTASTVTTSASTATTAAGTEQGAAAPDEESGSFGRFGAQSGAQDPTTTATTVASTATTTTAKGETTTTAKGETTTTAKGETTTTAYVPKNQWKVDVTKKEFLQLYQLEQAATLNASVSKPEDLQKDTVTLLSSDGTTVYELGKIAAKGDTLAGASAGLDPQGKWAVFPDFKSGANGIDKFNALAESCFNSAPECPALNGGVTGQAAIILDGEVLTAPSINSDDKQAGQAFKPYTAGKSGLQISGAFKEQEARDVATALKYGSLPLELKPSSAQKVSATLGKGALKAALIAGLVGLIAVCAYMLFYYRLLGVSTMFGLFISGGILWSLICWLGASMTLSGMVGIIVSIGVSLDSNVVFFENLKEDVRKGRTLRSAVEGSFKSAFSTMVKADLSSLIGAGVLYLLTAGPVRGFALFLFITTVIDLIVSYFWMRPATTFMARSKLGLRPALFGIPTDVDKAPVPAAKKDTAPVPAAKKDAAPVPAAKMDAAPVPAMKMDAAPTPSMDSAPLSSSERPSGDSSKEGPR